MFSSVKLGSAVCNIAHVNPLSALGFMENPWGIFQTFGYIYTRVSWFCCRSRGVLRCWDVLTRRASRMISCLSFMMGLEHGRCIAYAATALFLLHDPFKKGTFVISGMTVSCRESCIPSGGNWVCGKQPDPRKRWCPCPRIVSVWRCADDAPEMLLPHQLLLVPVQTIRQSRTLSCAWWGRVCMLSMRHLQGKKKTGEKEQ